MKNDLSFNSLKIGDKLTNKIYDGKGSHLGYDYTVIDKTSDVITLRENDWGGKYRILKEELNNCCNLRLI